jgi:hypothetical protein
MSEQIADHLNLIAEYDKLLSLLHHNAYVSGKEKKWEERINAALEERLRIMKLVTAAWKKLEVIDPEHLLSQLTAGEEMMWKLRVILTDIAATMCDPVSIEDEEQIRRIFHGLEKILYSP